MCMFNSKRLLCFYKHTFRIAVLRRGALARWVFVEICVTPLAVVISTHSVTKYSPKITVCGSEVFLRHSFGISL